MTAIYQAPRNEAELISSPPGILKFRGMCDSLRVSRIQGGALRLTRTCPVPRSWRVPTRDALCVWTVFACWDVWCGGETGWVPLLSSCVWTNVSLSNKIHRYSKGLKVTECMCSWSKLWTKGTKRQKSPSATCEESGAKAGHCACPLHSAPQGAGGPPKTPSSPPSTPLPTPSQGSSSPLLGE